jgi:Protein of unknown function (DUF2384)
VPRRTYQAWRRQPPLPRDELMSRLACIAGLAEMLTVIYGEKLARDWVKLPNANPLFSGRSPLGFMIAGGLPAMQAVQRLLGARAAGQ